MKTYTIDITAGECWDLEIKKLYRPEGKHLEIAAESELDAMIIARDLTLTPDQIKRSYEPKFLGKSILGIHEYTVTFRDTLYYDHDPMIYIFEVRGKEEK